MNTIFTQRLKALKKALFAGILAVLSVGAIAQAPLTGGTVYVVNGSGVDLVAPKDTFLNLMGGYVANSAYTDTTGIISALNAQGTDSTTIGGITILLAPGYSGVERFRVDIGNTTSGGWAFMSPQRAVTIKPATGFNVTITSLNALAANGSVIRFNGAQFVTIDGEGTVGQRNLTIATNATSTNTTAKVIDITTAGTNGCQFITIKNTRIVGNSTAGASAVVNTFAGIYSGGVGSTPSSPSRRNQQIRIENNSIEAVQNPIYIRGIESAPGSQDLNLVIINNNIGGTEAPVAGNSNNTTYIGGAANASGITLISQALATVSGNVIRNNLFSAAAVNFRGISLITGGAASSLDSAITIERNRIYNLTSTGAASGVYGIRVNLGTINTSRAIVVVNNTIADLLANNGSTTVTTGAYTAAIFIEGSSTNLGMSLFHNSIHLYGDTLNAGSFSACLVTASGITGGVSVRNNLFVNRMGRSWFSTGNAPVSYIYIVNSTTTNPFVTNAIMNTNGYYFSNNSGAYSFMGLLGTSVRESFLSWRTASFDNLSRLDRPSFIGVDDTTLTINNGAVSRFGMFGTNLGITSDINGNARPSSPSVGAYQFAGDSLAARYPLVVGATYLINGTDNWPSGNGSSGSFATLNSAIRYLNTYGVSRPSNAAGKKVNLHFATGYMGETNYVPALLNYIGSSDSAGVKIGVEPGINVTVTIPAIASVPNQLSILTIIGARYVTIDGAGTAGQRNLTWRFPANVTNNNISVITISSANTQAAFGIQVLNNNIQGASSSTAIHSAAGIYHGHYNVTSGAFGSALFGRNDSMNISNNFVTAVRTGIYLRGANAAGAQNRFLTVYRNTIGGYVRRNSGDSLTLIGGAANQAGIYVKGFAVASIDSNVIGNIDSTTNLSNGFRGIELDAPGSEAGVDSAIVISRNTIYNLMTRTGAFTTGIRMSLGGNNSRAIRMVNNSISGVRGVGTSGTGNISNPSGISIDASATVNNLGLEIFHNTISLSGNTLSPGNSSYCIFFGANVQGGVKVQNNTLTNKLGRASSGSGFSYAMFANTGNTTLPFLPANNQGASNGNAFGSDAPFTTQTILGTSAGNFLLLAAWRTTTSVDLNSYVFNAGYLVDSSTAYDPAFSAVMSQASVIIPGVSADIQNTPRTGTFTSTGSLVFAATFDPLQGNANYLINGTNNYPSSLNTPPYSFTTVASAIRYLNANGVDGLTPTTQRVTLTIDAGYIGEGDTLIPAIIQYPRMNPSRLIVLTLASGRNDTIRPVGTVNAIQAQGSVIRFNGGSYFMIDGSNNGTDSRNLTIMMPTNASGTNLKVIDLVAGEVPVQGVTVRNCNIIGHSTNPTTINTFAGIYMGGSTATPSAPVIRGNNNNVIENNFISNVRNGIYVQGITATAGSQDVGTIIRRNTIGDVTPSFGGVNNAAGIFVRAQTNAQIDSNIIRNNLAGFTGARGIDLSATAGDLSIDSNIRVTRNTIYNIRNSSTGAAYGISINLANDSLSAIQVANNAISAISSRGTTGAPSISLLNPYGIFVDASTAINNLGLTLVYNSVNLGRDTSLSNTANAASACVAFSANIRGGIVSRNNIFQNRLGRASGTGTATAVLVGHSANIFTTSDNNNYFVSAPNATNNDVAVYSATTASPVRYTTLTSYAAFTRQDTMSISFVVPFTNDTSLALQNVANVFQGWAVPFTGVSNDIFGNARSTSQPTIGAHEMPLGFFVDSVAPKIFNITTLPFFCQDGVAIPVRYRVFERTSTIASEILYYSVNGGPELQITSASSVSGFTRTYNIPAQPVNSSIAYRLVVTDNSSQSFTTNSPATGYDYTSTTISNFPLTNGFDLPNTNGWTVQSQGPNNTTAAGGWIINSFGSPNNPLILPATGVRAALFPANTLPSGTQSRLISPCLDLSAMTTPTVRIWASQNGEALTNLDRVSVTISGGFGLWSAPLGTIVRPVSGLPFPRFSQIDVCLGSQFVGNGFRIGILAESAGGNPIVLDSIVIFDDKLVNPVAPLTTTICRSTPINVTTVGVSNYNYTLVNAFDLQPIGGPTLPGANGVLNLTAPTPSIDSVYALVRYTNTLSGCNGTLPDTAKIGIQHFFNGPFITQGVPFTGVFSTTTLPDGAEIGDELNYTMNPPSGLTNADYGNKWTIVSPSVRTISGANISNSTFTAPTVSTNGNYQVLPGAPDADSVYFLSVTYRLLPTNCDSVITRRIRVTSAPTANFVPTNDSVCIGSTIFFSNTTSSAVGTGPISYTWDYGDGTTSNALNGVKIYDGPAGVYTVTLRATNNAGVFDETSRQITVLPRPSTVYTSTLACAGDSVQFTNTTPETNLTYLWSVFFNNAVVASSTLENPKFNLSVSDSFYVVRLRTTNSFGCSKDSSQQIFTFARPVANFTTTNSCLSANVALVNNSSISPGINGRVNTFGSEWTFGNGDVGFSNAPTYKYPASGEYRIGLKVISNYGCVDTTSRLITILPEPAASFTVGSACKDDQLAINNNTTYSNGIGNVAFSWNFGDNTGEVSGANPSKTYLVSGGPYTIRLIARATDNNCADTVTTIVNVFEKPIALVSVPALGCVGNNILLQNGSIPSGNETLTYLWDLGNSQTSTQTNPQVSYTTFGDKSIQMIATSIRGCKDTANATINIQSAPSVAFSNTMDSICRVTINAGPANPGWSYRFEFGDGVVITNSTAIASNTYTRKDTFDVTVTITNANGCSGFRSDTVITTGCIPIGLNDVEAMYNLSVYPNPFTSVANIAYSLDQTKDVAITIFDVLGRKVGEEVIAKQSAGNHNLELDAAKFNYGNGIYNIRIQIGGETITKQVIRN
ncbi:MAG: PKD domain-containing protein [Bacteroidia bacterium]|jgi:hypothetical protein|nr:PKD domain-containing protein [Bacteroidia bacterium]